MLTTPSVPVYFLPGESAGKGRWPLQALTPLGDMQGSGACTSCSPERTRTLHHPGHNPASPSWTQSLSRSWGRMVRAGLCARPPGGTGGRGRGRERTPGWPSSGVRPKGPCSLSCGRQPGLAQNCQPHRPSYSPLCWLRGAGVGPTNPNCGASSQPLPLSLFISTPAWGWSRAGG